MGKRYCGADDCMNEQILLSNGKCEECDIGLIADTSRRECIKPSLVVLKEGECGANERILDDGDCS